MRKILISLVSFYQYFISDILVVLLGRGCRYTPTCSEYSREALSKYGIVTGTYLTVRRVLRCNPLFKGGYDPLI